MPTIYDNLFSSEELTASINHLDVLPSLLQAIFYEDGVSSTKVSIERRTDSLALVPSVPRGAPGKGYAVPQRDALTFTTAHLPQRATVLADSLQNVRAFGQDNNYTAEQRQKELLLKMRADIDFTLEHMRFGAITGQVLDADGSVMFDLLTEFGVAKQTYEMNTSASTSKMRTAFVQARRLAEDALGNLKPKSWLCIASASFFDAVSDHPSSEQFLASTPAASQMREDMRGGFSIGGVDLVEYSYGTAGVPWIADGKAWLIPVGAQDLLIGRFAPSDQVGAINTPGLPYLVSSEPLPHGKGFDIEAQSNPIFLVTKPRAVIELTA